MIQFFYFVWILVRKHVKASEISIENRWYWRYHRYRHLSSIDQILVFKTYFCSSSTYKNLIKNNISISLLYACILMQCIEKTGGRTERHRIQAATNIIYRSDMWMEEHFFFSDSSNYLNEKNFMRMFSFTEKTKLCTEMSCVSQILFSLSSLCWKCAFFQTFTIFRK